MTIEEFIEKCKKREMPANPMARIKKLVRDLTEGMFIGLWPNKIITQGSDIEYNKYIPADENIRTYLQAIWGDTHIRKELLTGSGYYSDKEGFLEKAFDLLEETDPSTIFISYKRSESSAFALLMEDKLSQAGLSPFLDKQLQAGDKWHSELEARIKDSDYFIIILGKQTLKSPVTLKEIEWALHYKVSIIPIWHNGFTFNSEKWPQISAEIAEVISRTHAIRVLEENPLLYDTALRELLNRFGISG